MQIVYGLIEDGGDGSSVIRWFKDKELVDKLLTDDECNEPFYANEGSPAVTLTFPDELDLTVVGFRFADHHCKGLFD
jgi:hypothetical protein